MLIFLAASNLSQLANNCELSSIVAMAVMVIAEESDAVTVMSFCISGCYLNSWVNWDLVCRTNTLGWEQCDVNARHNNNNNNNKQKETNDKA